MSLSVILASLIQFSPLSVADSVNLRYPGRDGALEQYPLGRIAIPCFASVLPPKRTHNVQKLYI